MDPTEQQRAIIEHDWTRHARVPLQPRNRKERDRCGSGRTNRQRQPEFAVEIPNVHARRNKRACAKTLQAPGALTERPSTVHSFSISALLRNPGAATFPEPLRIPDDWEQKALIWADLARLTGVTPTKIKKKLVPEMAAMWESLVPEEDQDITPAQRARFLGAFQEHRWTYGYTLLAELPDLLRRALEEHDDEGLDYDALVIDEYQDLNACDLRLFKLLEDGGVSVIAIGDDNQSIYSFRKAAPEGIRRFCDEYHTDCDYPLTRCHRSPRLVIEWAQNVIAGDPHRLVRPPLEIPAEAPDGEVALLRFADGDSEAGGVARLIRRLSNEGGGDVPLSEILVLTRTDHNGCFSRPIRDALEAYGIESSDPDAVGSMLAEKEHRRLIAMLRLLVDRHDSLAWRTLLHLYSGVGARFIEYVYDQARNDGTRFGQALVAAAADGFDGGPRGFGRSSPCSV